MEFKARFELIGLFTLGVIAGVFGFVYWLNNGGANGSAKPLSSAVFPIPFRACQIGGGVFFNGVRVGEVTSLGFNPKNPNDLDAMISVKSSTPVREDTVVGIQYQGLTGIAGITLDGGSPASPQLASTNGSPPLMRAGSRVGTDMSQMAVKVLNELDGILVENRKPLQETVANIAVFSNVLSSNKDRIQNILGGLERMTGGSKKAAKKLVYDLIPPKDFSPPASPPSWRLVINEPTVLLALNTDKIQHRPKSGETMPLGIARWSDNLPNLFQEKIVQSYENAGYQTAVLRPLEGEDADNKLLLNIRGFHLSTKDQPMAMIEFTAKLQNAGMAKSLPLTCSNLPSRPRPSMEPRQPQPLKRRSPKVSRSSSNGRWQSFDFEEGAGLIFAGTMSQAQRG